MYAHCSCIDVIFLLYLMSCVSYASNILVVSDGVKSAKLGGLQADFKGGGGRLIPLRRKIHVVDLS